MSPETLQSDTDGDQFDAAVSVSFLYFSKPSGAELYARNAKVVSDPGSTHEIIASTNVICR